MSDAIIQKTEGPRTVTVRALVGHAALLCAFFVPCNKILFWTAFVGYFVREFGVEGAAHRYFAHRSFKTSRFFQFLLGVLAAASGQRGPIWWAAHHRKHHRFSDMTGDPYYSKTSKHPRWHAFLGWVYVPGALDTNLAEVKDLSRFPELVWVNKHHYIFPLAQMVIAFVLGQYTTVFGAEGMGFAALIWAFFVPTVLSQHPAYWVGAWAHGVKPGLFNKRRFETSDTTTNIGLLAILTMGGSYHNNHHRYMNAARAGFYWHEIDLAYWVIKGLALMGIVWDIHEVPQKVLDEGRASTGLNNAEVR